MAEVDRHLFTHKEVVTALLKEQKIHEGVWSLVVEFGLAALNMGPDDDQLSPTAVVPVQKIGITRVDKVNSLSVDAADVNPLSTTKAKKQQGK